jgi:hypothetical protein
VTRWLALLWLCGCGGSTGSALVSFSACAAGPGDAARPLRFTTGLGYTVALDRASLHVAAIYLNQAVPTSGAQESSCVLPGVYVGQVFGPVDVDLLDPAPVVFPRRGDGTQTRAATAEVWLAGGAIDAPDDATVIFAASGTAARGGAAWPFDASITIGRNRQLPVQNPAMPGAQPICHQRIVTPIPADLVPTDGGRLELRIDPREMFHGVEFADATPVDGGRYQIPDEAGGIGGALFSGVRAAIAYRPTFTP